MSNARDDDKAAAAARGATPPRRVFLDTNVVNLTLDYGQHIHSGTDLPEGIVTRTRENVEGLRGIFDTGQRAYWEFAISPLTYREITATKDDNRRHQLASWFFELWDYWRSMIEEDDGLPTFAEAEQTRLDVFSSGILDVLPHIEDRVLLTDAITYRCECFCTFDFRSIIRHRAELTELPIRIITPAEWWAEIDAWYMK